MASTKTIRQRIENILIGDFIPADTRFSISSGRFKLHDKDTGSIEMNYDSVAERKIQVLCGPIGEIDSVNHMDGFGLYEFDLTVKVSYFLTNSGDDMPEGSTEIEGTGYIEDINDRANADSLDIKRCVTWYENYGGLTPDVFSIVDKSFTMEVVGKKVIASTVFQVRFQNSLLVSNV